MHNPLLADDDSLRVIGPILCVWFNGLYTICLLGACKCAFWEVIIQSRDWNSLGAHGNGRWISLGFDAALFLFPTRMLDSL